MANTVNTIADTAIENHKAAGCGTTRLFMLWSGLKLEIKIPGMRLTRKAPKCSTILRQEFNLSGKPTKLLELYEALLIKHGLRDEVMRGADNV